jgi:hypothetical protein
MPAPTLIYCADGNSRLAQIAINAGWLYGAQLPRTIYFDPYFVDQNWKKYQKALERSQEKADNLRDKYFDALKSYRPYMASVLDWERTDQLCEVLSWAEEIARYVEVVMIIPKVQGGIPSLPRTIGGKRIRLGYSIPTGHGGTGVPYSDFRGWDVHLLGGSPHKQMYLTGFMSVVSVDGNMHNKMAHKNRFWRHEKGERGHWVNLYEVGDRGWGKDSNYEAFRRSCENIYQCWQQSH